MLGAPKQLVRSRTSQSLSSMEASFSQIQSLFQHVSSILRIARSQPTSYLVTRVRQRTPEGCYVFPIYAPYHPQDAVVLSFDCHDILESLSRTKPDTIHVNKLTDMLLARSDVQYMSACLRPRLYCDNQGESARKILMHQIWHPESLLAAASTKDNVSVPIYSEALQD